MSFQSLTTNAKSFIAYYVGNTNGLKTVVTNIRAKTCYLRDHAFIQFSLTPSGEISGFVYG